MSLNNDDIQEEPEKLFFDFGKWHLVKGERKVKNYPGHTNIGEAVCIGTPTVYGLHRLYSPKDPYCGTYVMYYEDVNLAKSLQIDKFYI